MENNYKVFVRVPFKMGSISRKRAICEIKQPNMHELVLIVENIALQHKRTTTVSTGVKFVSELCVQHVLSSVT